MASALKLGVVGCGRVFEIFHLPALESLSSWDLVAACDGDPGRQHWIAQALPGLPRFTSLDQMIEGIELDAILIATPPRQHIKLATRAIDRGLHVLIEKPGGRGLSDAEALTAASSASNRLIWIGYNRRFNSSYSGIRNLLRDIADTAQPKGRFELSFSVGEWDSVSGYLGDESEGGDVLRDVAAHQIDLLASIFSSPVASARILAWDRHSSTEERISYDVRLESGTTIRCLAEHGEKYREILTVDCDNIRLLSYPTGWLRASQASWRTLEREAAWRYWIDRKLIRIGMRADPQKLSYRYQLDSFAMAIRGGRPRVVGTNVDSMIMTHRAMQLMLESRDMSAG